jgi:hypothetical protein
MNPILKRFAQYSSFHKYEYRDVSKPDQSLSEQFSNFKKIFFKWTFKTSYIKDLKSLKDKSPLDLPGASTLKFNYFFYKLSEVSMLGYCLYSFYWHFKQGYFHSGSRIAEIYIVGKISATLFVLSAVSFFILKKTSDRVMYEYFSVKEAEWDRNKQSKKKENEYISEYVEEHEKKHKWENKK